MSDASRAERISQKIPISFSSGSISLKGMSSNFSASGLFILTDSPFKPGNPIEMVLETSKNDKLYLTGVVARTIRTGSLSYQDGMGIKLIAPSFAYHSFINSLKH